MNLPDPTEDAVNHSLSELASPYEVSVQNDIVTNGIKLIMSDRRPKRRSSQFIRLVLSPENLAEDGVGVLRKAVLGGKKRLQKELSQKCDEPELRLWAAQYRDVDLMDNSPIPKRVRTAYDQWLDGQVADRTAAKKTSEEGSPNVTAHKSTRKVVRSSTKSGTTSGQTQVEKKSVPQVSTVKGARPKQSPRKPRCKSRDHDEPPEMEFDPEAGAWRCSVPGCNLVARVPNETPVGTVQLGKEPLDIRVMYPEPGGKPSVLIVSADNVALDITGLVDMAKFEEFSKLTMHAKNAASNGQKTADVRRQVTALLRFNSMKILGCDNA